MLGIKKSSGLTLTELIISTIIVGIMMVGITSMDVAFRRSQMGTSRKALLSMRASVIMLEISKDAQLATGDQSSMGVDTSVPDTLCIRREDPSRPPPLVTPGDYTDDDWACYTHLGNHLYKCMSIHPAGPVNCTGGAADEDLGAVTGFIPKMIVDIANHEFCLEVDLTTIYNPAIGANAIDNPDFNLKARFNLISHSF